MMYYQHLARKSTHLPVFMSALAQLPAITCGYAHDELIAIFTANSRSSHTLHRTNRLTLLYTCAIYIHACCPCCPHRTRVWFIAHAARCTR